MKLFSPLVRCVKGLKSKRPRPKPQPFCVRPVLECLEDRCLPSTLTELPVLPTANAAPTGITGAADGSVWFAEQNASKLGRIGTNGVLTEYTVPTANSAPQNLTATPDGNVWFTERYGGKIGRISDSGGAIAEFTLPGTGTYPTAITTDASGKVWFAAVQQPGTARIGSISSTGRITELATAASRTTITGIVAGPDGNLWVTQVSPYWGDSVAKVTTSGWGSFTNYMLPNHSAGPQSITVGPDNNLWFTESGDDKIGEITTRGLLIEYALPTGSQPQQIVSGPDGALWFTEKGTNKIGRMTTRGQLTELAVPTASSQPFGIAKGANGALWFTEQSGNRMGEVVV